MNEAMIEMKKYGPRKSQEEWAEINAQWERSGKRRKEFCRELGIRETSFAYWRGRLKKKTQPEETANFAIASVRDCNEKPSSGTEGHLKIEYPNGVVLNLHCELNGTNLRMVRSLLELPPCQ